MQYSIQIDKIHIEAGRFQLIVRGSFFLPDEITGLRLIMYFTNGLEERRLPVVINEREWKEQEGICTFTSDYIYRLDFLFWEQQHSANDILMYFNLLCGDSYEEKISVDLTPQEMEQDGKCFLCHAEGDHLRFVMANKWQEYLEHYEKRSLLRIREFAKRGFGFLRRHDKIHRIRHIQKKHQLQKSFLQVRQKEGVVQNRISFLSVRSLEMEGNFVSVYKKIKEADDLDIQMYLNTKDLSEMSRGELDRFAYLCATSKVIVLDEYTPGIYELDLATETKVVQLWHACGAFKTFGYSRLGKPMGTAQTAKTHRNYDYVTVSGTNVRECYAEGFGIPLSHVIPTGIPRTDIFFDPAYRETMRTRLEEKYPLLCGKKVILFAPTFRGNVREDAYYPMDQFRVGEFLQAIPDDYFLIIKHHPFVTEQHPIPEEVRDRVLNLSASGEEVNDLMFVADLIITDYSSLVFEGSLLNLPMMFYTFDLKQYISERDFYFDFETFVPGNFFYTQQELQKAIIERNFAQEKVKVFAQKFFDYFDGHSSERVTELLYQAMGEQRT